MSNPKTTFTIIHVLNHEWRRHHSSITWSAPGQTKGPMNCSWACRMSPKFMHMNSLCCQPWLRWRRCAARDPRAKPSKRMQKSAFFSLISSISSFIFLFSWCSEPRQSHLKGPNWYLANVEDGPQQNLTFQASEPRRAKPAERASGRFGSIVFYSYQLLQVTQALEAASKRWSFPWSTCKKWHGVKAECTCPEISCL